MREGVAVEELSEGEWGTRRFVSQLCTKNITNVKDSNITNVDQIRTNRGN